MSRREELQLLKAKIFRAMQMAQELPAAMKHLQEAFRLLGLIQLQNLRKRGEKRKKGDG